MVLIFHDKPSFDKPKFESASVPFLPQGFAEFAVCTIQADCAKTREGAKIGGAESGFSRLSDLPTTRVPENSAGFSTSSERDRVFARVCKIYENTGGALK
jgi:hypothetical protein